MYLKLFFAIAFVFIVFFAATYDGKEFSYQDKSFEVGSIHYLKISFVPDATYLDTSSVAEINSLVSFLKLNGRLKVTIENHCDFRGNEKYNLKLSQKRSEALKAMMVKKGITASRLEAIGMGSSKLLVTKEEAERENTLEKREALILKNRRTLIRITALQ